jgi:3-dehydroquinate dehydratase/shikimate dehydrogenase
MLFGVVRGPSYKEAIKQLEKAIALADGVEFRFDLFNFSEIEELVRGWKKLSLFTYRGASKEVIWKLLTLEPDFFDIDIREDFSWLEEAKKEFPKTRWILSYHDHEGLPADLESLLKKMREIPAFAYKIAATAKNTLDALRMLKFVQNHEHVIGIAMGEEGQASRILGPIVGNLIDYAALGEAFSGQLDIEELCKVYRYKILKKGDPIYALLGDPVCYSKGHLHHNVKLKRGVYIKLKLRSEEIQPFRELISELPFAGFSVTMPLKKQFIPELAINTIAIREQDWDYTNTDGSAAADLIEKHMTLQGTRCLILGAGGAAEGFARALIARGARITIANRTRSTAEALAKQIGAQVCDLNHLSDYDVILQATSVGMSPHEEEMPIRNEQILPGRLVFEAVRSPLQTRFLKAAESMGCPIINGEDLWQAQADLQQSFWAPDL